VGLRRIAAKRTMGTARAAGRARARRWPPPGSGDGPQAWGRRYLVPREDRPAGRGRSRPASALGLLGCLLAAAALSACGVHPQSALQPVGPVGRIELQLLVKALWIMLGVFVVVAAWLVVALVRFRERPGQQGLPPQVEGNHFLELLWTIVPFILLVVLAIPTFKDSFVLAARQTGPNTLDVVVVGHQWWWEFDYPQYGIVTADEMHIPVGYKVNLTLKSADVLHSFWVPALGGKEDTVPGQDNTMWLEADQPGTYPGQCAEFCGTSHSQMRLLVIAQSPEEFQAWVREMQHPDSQPHSAQAKQGMQVFAAQCATCHAIDGTPYTSGKVGPNLTALSLHQTLAAGVLTNDPDSLTQWISDPKAIMPDTIMPSFDQLIPPDQIAAVVAYLEGLK
jgi:cytochrome c oxidase subunit 2